MCVLQKHSYRMQYNFSKNLLRTTSTSMSRKLQSIKTMPSLIERSSNSSPSALNGFVISCISIVWTHLCNLCGQMPPLPSSKSCYISQKETGTINNFLISDVQKFCCSNVPQSRPTGMPDTGSRSDTWASRVERCTTSHIMPKELAWASTNSQLRQWEDLLASLRACTQEDLK